MCSCDRKEKKSVDIAYIYVLIYVPPTSTSDEHEGPKRVLLITFLMPRRRTACNTWVVSLLVDAPRQLFFSLANICRHNSK